MIAQFALRLMFGMSAMWSLMPRHQVSVGFFRIQMLIVMGLSVLATLTFGELSHAPETSTILPISWGTPLCIALGVLAFFGSAFWTIDFRRVGTVIVFAIMILSGGLLVGSTLTSWSSWPSWLAALGEISTALSLGGAMTGMLLGHWYLTAPTKSISPLNTLNRLFGLSVGSRLIVSAIALASGWAMLQSETHWLWLSLRWLAGIIGPLILVVMVSRILRYKNTQSATGVLFVGVILTFIGELSATLLTRELHLPF
ncbi:MAG: hypothetical protein KDA84_06595 [Planctomycetaceae bacterium]|nr:hypothetical protein [Planctomycetaceae bacterium]